ncbi:MAG: hypothetical protein ACRET2_13210 [Steroidobacteraceae bacterium]
MTTQALGLARRIGIPTVALAFTAALALCSPAYAHDGSGHGFAGRGASHGFAGHGSGGVEHFSARRGHAYTVRPRRGNAFAARGYGRYYGGHGAAHAYIAPRRGYGASARIRGSQAWAGRRWGARGPRGYRANWGGGWWHGYYWPRASYGWAYPWFLAALPLGCATYWWGGVPYYYANSVYYIWSAGDAGYVVTDPPPVADASVAADDSAASADSIPPAAASASAPSPDDIYMYPKNGQSAQQQSTDRYQCHQWAEQQTGFDPTRPASQSSGNATGYHRAMVACLEGRGYSVD